MSRTFDQILSDVTAQSDPQRKIVLGQIADLPNQQAAQTSALGAQKDQAYQDITSQAQQRGLGFSGIPLGEQAKYNATTYAPALANLATSFNNQKGTLESSLAGLGQNDYSTANGIFNQQQSLAEQQREFDANLAEQKRQAASQSASAAGLGALFAPPPQAAPKPVMTAKPKGGGFNFSDPTGSAISAASYAQQTGTPIGTLLKQMGQSGDKYAQQAYNEISTNQAYYNKHPDVLMREFAPLFWGS